MSGRADGPFEFLDEQIIYNHWNTTFATVKEIPKHKSIVSKVIKNTFGRYFALNTIIRETLRSYTVEEIKNAITLYHDTYTDNSHFYNHAYSLAQFLHYGNRNGTGFVYFLNKKPKKVYKKTTEEIVDSIRKLFKPTTEKWSNQKILDPDRQTYYGFDLDKVRNWKERKSDLEGLLKIFEKGGIQLEQKFLPKTEWKFGDIWRLELVIAGMLFHRKDLVQKDKDDLKRYFLLWQKVIKGET